MKKKRCKKCGVWFTQKCNVQKYCSKRCSRLANIERACEYNRAHPKKAAFVMRKFHCRNKYGITIDDYNKLFQQQKGRCAICEQHQVEFKIRLGIDHDHKTDEIRGLLCSDCNRSIGRVENNWSKREKFYRKIKIYLAKSK